MNNYDGKIVIGTEINTKQFDAQIKVLKNKLNDIESSLQMASKDKTLFSTSEIEEMNAEAEKLRNKIGSLQGDFKKTNKETSKGFDKVTKSLKRFALSLFSVGSIFAGVSKASSAWLSQDTELAQKLQNVWIGLGALVSPVIEKISDLMLKALGYLNEFVKALSGGRIDFIAKANAKALEKQTKAQAKLNKETQQYDFDVIRRQQNISSTSTGEGIDTSGLINIPELNENIVKKLQDMAKWLKENWYWIKEVGKAILLVFGIKAIEGILKNIGLLTGSESSHTGIAGLTKLLKDLATIGVITIGVDILYSGITGRNLVQDLKDILKGFEELKGAHKQNTKTSKGLTEQSKNLSSTIDELGENGELTGEKLQHTIKALEVTKNNSLDLFETMERSKTFFGNFNGDNKEVKKGQEEVAEQLKITTNDYKKLYEQGLLNDTQTKDYEETLGLQIITMDKLGKETQNLKTDYEKLTGKTWTIKIEREITDKYSGLNYKSSNKGAFIEGLENLFKPLGNLFIPLFRNQRKMAQGGIVTQPTRALIGEGGYPEAVVPLTDNYLKTLANLIGQYNSGSGQNVTNVYLNGRLIQREISKTQDKINFATNK